MMRVLTHISIVFFCLLQTALAHAQESCDFLSLDAVSKAFPQYQPWRVAGGGTGMCRFEGEHRINAGRSVSITTTLFNVTQQFQQTPKEATEFVRNMKAEMGKAYKLSALQGAGPESFFYADATGSMNVMSWYSHSGKMVLSGMFMPPGNQQMTSEEEAAVKALVAEATAGSSKPGMAERAGQCPQLDPALVKKLLSPTGLKVQQFGNDSCMANDAANSVVLFSRNRFKDEVTGSQLAESKANSGCKFEKLAELGVHGLLAHSCTMGNPRAEVFFVKGLSAYEFSVVPGNEPTAQQRADLIALAKRSFDAK